MAQLPTESDMSTVTYDDQTFDIDEVRDRMDPDLIAQIEGTVDTDQDFFESYLIAHNEKYGKRFTVR